MQVEILTHDGYDGRFSVVPVNIWGTPHESDLICDDWIDVLKLVRVVLSEYKRVYVYTLNEDETRGDMYDSFTSEDFR